MATRKPPADTIDVAIYDSTYTLRGGSDPSAVRALAKDLDARMKALASSAPAADPLKVAILCALRLSDEAREARESLEAFEQDLSTRIDACTARIDRLLLPEEPAAPEETTGPRSQGSRALDGNGGRPAGAIGGRARTSHP